MAVEVPATAVAVEGPATAAYSAGDPHAPLFDDSFPGGSPVTIAEIEALFADGTTYTDGSGLSSWDLSPPTSPPDSSWYRPPTRRLTYFNAQTAVMLTCSAVAAAAVVLANGVSSMRANGVLSIYRAPFHINGVSTKVSSVSSLYGTFVALACLALVLSFAVGILNARAITRVWAIVLPGMPIALTAMLLISDDPQAHVQTLLNTCADERLKYSAGVPIVAAILGAIHATMPRPTAWAIKVGAIYAAGVVVNTVVISVIGARDPATPFLALRLLLSRCGPFAVGYGVARHCLPLSSRAKGLVAHVDAPGQ